MSFDEFDYMINKSKELEKAYKAGAQSRQAEIDELQKRIDDALNEFEENNDPWASIVDEVIKILKGEIK